VPEVQVGAACASTGEEEAREPLGDATAGVTNNYARPSGQNTGNFLTDKPSSRVLAPPGGRTSITLG
jgi:SPIRAL1-like protein